MLASSGRELTTADLAEELPDVPQASLYRHVSVLADAGILHVANERPVRGTVERTYRLATGAALVTAEDSAEMTADEHEQAFAAFAGALVDAFGRYVRNPAADPATDGMGYRQVPLWLDDAELQDLADEMREVLERYVSLPERADRRRRSLTTIIIPDPPTVLA